MNVCYLLLGSNLGDRIEMLQKATSFIFEKIGNITQKSGIYETQAWGNAAELPFLNQALKVKTKLSAYEVLSQILQIEHSLGRQRFEKWGNRSIDIDILLFNQEIIQTQRLSVPHPFLHVRRFALVPLAEIAPELMHPQLQFSIAQILEKCPDTLSVYNINSPNTAFMANMPNVAHRKSD
ncbi:MAG: 2-amino-4-hydroxy-6-hydroxymethyldihydropteridine diphosphokinase [Chitinophagales bacterium]|nr:2-amino-4-hydroxy-6-hydroxymethyldihydropteridine diphosphokinase [Bacteroidota bacterium]MCB9042978.1 2-amino-4-hydroxy-6-hydroxymethyldihydropteridine diphosphokinase [Chitinophagales bacterium]